jgi:hypothetical protein
MEEGREEKLSGRHFNLIFLTAPQVHLMTNLGI